MIRNKIRLLATMITLAAVTTIALTPATAQHRSSGSQSTRTVEKRSDSARKNSSQKKSTNNAKSNVQRSSKQKTITTDRRTSSSSLRSERKINSGNKSRSVSAGNSATLRNNKGATSYKTAEKRENYKEKPVVKKNKRTTPIESRNRTKSDIDNRKRSSTSKFKTSSDKHVYANSVSSRDRRSSLNNTDNRTRYRLDKNDKRYIPNKEYRGSSKTWTNRYRPEGMNYNHKLKKFNNSYNYHSLSHWDRKWEKYRWNHYSWIDYYRGYHPHSYIYHAHYYYHNHYGHVIRYFDYEPYVFIHNQIPYYCYDGHFFRYKRGVGYILADLPFGFVFDVIPHGYERVYINGYLYFRIGNLFFEYGNHAFHLVHYPERYLAYDNSFRNEAYWID